MTLFGSLPETDEKEEQCSLQTARHLKKKKRSKTKTNIMNVFRLARLVKTSDLVIPCNLNKM